MPRLDIFCILVRGQKQKLCNFRLIFKISSVGNNALFINRYKFAPTQKNCNDYSKNSEAIVAQKLHCI